MSISTLTTKKQGMKLREKSDTGSNEPINWVLSTTMGLLTINFEKCLATCLYFTIDEQSNICNRSSAIFRKSF